VPFVYACLIIFGAARAFSFPALTALLPAVVPEDQFMTAVALNSSTFQLAAVIGPAIAGVLIALTGHGLIVYLCDAVMMAVVVGLMSIVQVRPAEHTKQARTIASLIDGWRFLWSNQIILAALTLDLFAVLLGGATSLLPIYAKDILKVGPVGLGWMRAVPSIGSFLMAFLQAHRRPHEHAGRTLLLAVAGFGVATIIFGYSRSFLLSLLALFTLGALDNISVVIRQSLIVLRTPDEMRGRVASVNSLFVSSTNELGGFESGVVAAAFGPVFSVVAGGVGTILVVLAVSGIWPQLRRLGGIKQ
jgi:MFS family permease